jgi:hypothetical protein
MVDVVEVLVRELTYEDREVSLWTALVEVEGRKERWPISEADAQRLYRQLHDEPGAVDTFRMDGLRTTYPPRLSVRAELERPLALMPLEL